MLILCYDDFMLRLFFCWYLFPRWQSLGRQKCWDSWSGQTRQRKSHSCTVRFWSEFDQKYLFPPPLNDSLFAACKQTMFVCQARGGVMLVGPTGGGKTTARLILQHALLLLPAPSEPQRRNNLFMQVHHTPTSLRYTWLLIYCEYICINWIPDFSENRPHFL